VRRPAPRPLGAAIPAALAEAQPATPLARIQSAWPTVAGAGLAGRSTVVAEREGVVSVVCESAVWAQELELLAPQLLQRLNAKLAGDRAATVARLRFVVGSLPNDR
jgi:predicted nucleic acid-binding Zn ribbon protein